MLVRPFTLVPTALLTAIVLASAKGAADTAASARPPSLEGRTGCELFTGTVSGNDPTVLIEALICEGMDGAVTGQLQWSSLKSGYSVRDIAGSFADGHQKLTLHDTKLVVSKPNPGWLFCIVDQYDLRSAGDRLDGSYRSQRCHDTATVKLTRKARPAAPSPPLGPTGEKPSAGVGETEAVPAKPVARPSSCACEVASGRSPEAFWLALLVLTATLRRAKSSATRATQR